MAVFSKRGSFTSEQEVDSAMASLVAMTKDDSYHTPSSYSANSELYPDNVMPFVDKHMNYMRTHNVNPQHYISNLRITHRIR